MKDKDTYVNNIPYVVYIPPETNTSRLEEGGINVSLTRDYFKKNAPVTKMIPASVRFDSVLFNEADRGRPMKELAEAFNAKYPDEESRDSLSRERYEIVGTFNNWGNWSDIELFRFEKNLTLKLSKGDRFKIHKCCTDCWYGGECIDWNKSVSCMTAVNDNYGGWNIYVCEDGQYKIAFDCGVIRICESEIATAEIHKDKYKYEYEILGSFNRWGGAGNPFDFRFDSEMKVCLHKSDIFKVHKYGTDIWYGYDKLDCDGCIGNFSGVNDNYNGLNIYVKKTGNYNIQIISGKIYISEQ